MTAPDNDIDARLVTPSTKMSFNPEEPRREDGLLKRIWIFRSRASIDYGAAAGSNPEHGPPKSRHH